MDNGISDPRTTTWGRVEIVDREEIDRLTLKPSVDAVKEIERMEELSLIAEHKLGTFVVR